MGNWTVDYRSSDLEVQRFAVFYCTPSVVRSVYVAAPSFVRRFRVTLDSKQKEKKLKVIIFIPPPPPKLRVGTYYLSADESGSTYNTSTNNKSHRFVFYYILVYTRDTYVRRLIRDRGSHNFTVSPLYTHLIFLLVFIEAGVSTYVHTTYKYIKRRCTHTERCIGGINIVVLFLMYVRT